MDPVTTIGVILGAASLSGVGLWLHDRSNRRLAQKLLTTRPQMDPLSFGRVHFGERRALLAAEVREILARHVPFSLNGLAPDDTFVKDLRMDELDSLSTVEFLLEVEEHFGIKVAEPDAAAMRTLRDLVEYLDRQGVRPTGSRPEERGSGLTTG